MRILIILLFLTANCQAYTLDQWADAIRKAEGNANYGVLSPKYPHKRQTCKATVKHAFRDFIALNGNPSDLNAFTEFLSRRYAPIGAENDPNGLNVNWKTNVLYFLKKG